MIKLEEMTLKHAYKLARTMREDDRRECEALGHEPRRGMRRAYYESIIKKTVLVDEKVAACYGVTGSHLGNIIHPWLLTTPLVEKNFLPLVFLYRDQVHEWLRHYSRLENFCDSRYTKSLKLLKIMGFTVEKPEPIGPMGIPFCRFWIEA